MIGEGIMQGSTCDVGGKKYTDRKKWRKESQSSADPESSNWRINVFVESGESCFRPAAGTIDKKYGECAALSADLYFCMWSL